ncbi:terpenoid synthase [Laetiporus sulphureus 93-53]|uniref:Terpene synthase n=1 Tax=Laetiporus sulphureus 93-53 TaxID=1314785 RepID=A0A165DEV3_9APHY|nr:terpenoid synthase [Laetiporus sulphureus 93-53]KZT04734.1 terpenoid synthase [Laetiporus sulphureus 93-53]
MPHVEQTIAFLDIMKLVPFPIRLSPYTRYTSADSDAFITASANFTEKQRTIVSTDFLNFVFNLDDWTDEFDATEMEGLQEAVMNTMRYPENFHSDTVTARITRSMLKTNGPNCKECSIDGMESFLRALAQQATDRDLSVIPDLDAYIALRRETSGCKSAFTLIEYAANIDLPNEVFEDPVFQDMMAAANDNISWSNDLFSYNREQSRKDPHNLVAIMMYTHEMGKQAAIEHVGDMCNKAVERFLTIRAKLPSWGPEIDAQVKTYIQGLQDWMRGRAEWSFMTERYFGKDAPVIRKGLQVQLMPVVGTN